MLAIAFKLLGLFGANPAALLTEALHLWTNSQNVDLAKFQSSGQTTAELAMQVVQANEKYAEVQEQYNISILQWWPFRMILFILLLVPALHFILIVLDSMRPHLFGWPPLGIPPVPKPYDAIEQNLLLFFVIAKPVDTAVSGALAVLSRYLRK